MNQKQQDAPLPLNQNEKSATSAAMGFGLPALFWDGKDPTPGGGEGLLSGHIGPAAYPARRAPPPRPSRGRRLGLLAHDLSNVVAQLLFKEALQVGTTGDICHVQGLAV